jgi:hypothetical protein
MIQELDGMVLAEWVLAMTYIADLHRTVAATLASQRLGQPLFVRYHWFGPEPLETLATRLAQITAVIRGWLGQDVHRLHAMTAEDRTHAALTLQFQTGATALISLTRTPSSEVRVDLMILGNHGALYHDEERVLLSDAATQAAWQPTDPHLQDKIERALRIGQSPKT